MEDSSLFVGNRSHPKNLETISAIRRDIPSYERRITKREFKNAFGFFAPSYILRNIFKNLTNDQSAAHDFNEAEIDRRLEFSLMTGDEGIMVDLRQQKSDEEKDSRFKMFFNKTELYLREEIGILRGGSEKFM